MRLGIGLGIGRISRRKIQVLQTTGVKETITITRIVCASRYAPSSWEYSISNAALLRVPGPGGGEREGGEVEGERVGKCGEEVDREIDSKINGGGDNKEIGTRGQ